MGGVVIGFARARHNPCGYYGKRFSVFYRTMFYPVHRYPQVRYGIRGADTVALAFVPLYSLDALDESRQPSIAPAPVKSLLYFRSNIRKSIFLSIRSFNV